MKFMLDENDNTTLRIRRKFFLIKIIENEEKLY
jgi:hypothetical protein